MVAKNILAIILLRVILPLAVILVIVFGVWYFGFERAYGVGLFEAVRIEKDVKQVIAEFMEAGASRDIEAAYACCYGESVSEEGIVELIEKRYDDVFVGYKSLTTDRMWVPWNIMRLRVVATYGVGDDRGIDSWYVEDDIIYASGKVLRFEALMEKENGVWKISGIRVGHHMLIMNEFLTRES